MGMPGMNTADFSNYAKSTTENKKEDNVTVAEFRNKINPTTHYYDNYNFDSFLNDNSISFNEKLEVILGKLAAKLVDNSKLEKIIKEAK